MIDLESFRFEFPVYLWLLAIPGALLAVLVWRVARRRSDVGRFVASRRLPMRERFTMAGELTFWMAVLVASSLCIAAVARPQARTGSVRQASADVVVLLDGSASMYVTDVRPNRWRRSITFLRAFAESIRWQGDRVALALFAQSAAPQVRLTKDPNALFFFIDHLGDTSPFRLENAPTWDTNIEEGLRWGLRLVDMDERLFGASTNTKAFVVVSDGQAWSGTVATALAAARDRRIPVYVVGIGTTEGGMIPEPMREDGTRPPPVLRSVLDRESLVKIAVAGGGEYFEIGDEPDTVVAFRIIERLRRRALTARDVETFDDLYPQFLLAAAAVIGVGTLALRKRTELVWQAIGAATAVVVIASIL